MKYVKLSPEVACGDSPRCDEDVQALADERFQSIFNIRTCENDAEYPSREEGISAGNSQLIYLNSPLAEDDLNEFHISAFCTKLKLLPAPTYVHGDDLSRAALLCVIDHALKQDWPASRALEFADEKDLPCCEEPWTSRLLEALRAA